MKFTYRVDGGVYNPKLGDFDMKTLINYEGDTMEIGFDPNKFPRIENLGLRVMNQGRVVQCPGLDNFTVQASDLEHLLQNKSQRVYGKGQSQWVWSDHENFATNTHTALLIGIEPIKKGVSKKELIDFLKTFHFVSTHRAAELQGEAKKIFERIESEGIISD